MGNYHRESEVFRLALDSTEELYLELRRHVSGVINHELPIRTLETWLQTQWEELTEWHDLTAFAKSLIHEPDFSELARDYVENERTEREVVVPLERTRWRG